jgi:hypothetical protein
MTGTEPVPDRPALWAALSHMQIPVPGADLRFEEALAERQGWTTDFAERVTDEYRRFLYLAATAGCEVTPSRVVDEAWHFHLEGPHYSEILCGRMLGRPLEHRPAIGEPGEEDRHRRQYEATVDLYERAFLSPPPSDIWPDALGQEERQAAARWRRGRGIAYELSASAGFAALAALLLGYPTAMIVLSVGAVILALLAPVFFPAEARARSDGGCGTYAGCGGGSNGDSCGASCGGGGCGGD